MKLLKSILVAVDFDDTLDAVLAAALLEGLVGMFVDALRASDRPFLGILVAIDEIPCRFQVELGDEGRVLFVLRLVGFADNRTAFHRAVFLGERQLIPFAHCANFRATGEVLGRRGPQLVGVV